MSEERCGYVAIIGRPNVGKSTLLNRLIGQKISITSHKPQTTRHRLLGIKTLENAQIIYIDTPGLHKNRDNVINRYINREAVQSINEVDLIVFLIDTLQWTAQDEYVLSLIKSLSTQVILAINKIDTIKNKEILLPFLQEIVKKHHFTDIFPISAKNGVNVIELEKKIVNLLPYNPPLFPADQVTDKHERFLCAELIREKLMRYLGAEVPYRLGVTIEHFAQDERLVHISAIIWVETVGQKTIIIGKKGGFLKQIGQLARLDIEKLLGNRVFLQLWVKVKAGWCDNEQDIQQIEYFDSFE
jgi:GTP-binding protein Era